MEIFPKIPTTNYIQPLEAVGVCALASLTSACESVQYQTIATFIRVIATQKGLKAEDEIKLYQ